VYAKQIHRLHEKDITGTIRLPGQGFDYRSDPAFAPGFIAGITYEISSHFHRLKDLLPIGCPIHGFQLLSARPILLRLIYVITMLGPSPLERNIEMVGFPTELDITMVKLLLHQMG